ncbi:transcriptional regulator, GntR family [Arboricoccus pini]|uniref:Transcriptional regulator, GntR family n=1 Tax=Arboricoccus pini TaxID=1963835 RepID=A0A212R0P5_9PROT|nr:GntR family transcriptional regulator [Arboricoccus pini]SNB65555.1 transcriptional regulator, GntR family [Arboricoccus pini]
MSEPRYQLLARELSAAIAGDRYPAGSMLPSEVDLASRFGVSRATVRAALDILEHRGLVQRRRGAGTTVLKPGDHPGFGQTIGTIEELIQYARDTRRIVHSVKTIIADIELADRLGIAPGSRWLRIRATRSVPGTRERPICLTDTYVLPELADVRQRLANETLAVCDMIERDHEIVTESIDQQLQAVLVPREAVSLLEAEAGGPALRILRRYYATDGRLFEVTDSLHPADRFAYRMSVTRARRLDHGETDS